MHVFLFVYKEIGFFIWYRFDESAVLCIFCFDLVVVQWIILAALLELQMSYMSRSLEGSLLRAPSCQQLYSWKPVSRCETFFFFLNWIL